MTIARRPMPPCLSSRNSVTSRAVSSNRYAKTPKTPRWRRSWRRTRDTRGNRGEGRRWGGMLDESKNPNRTAELCDIMWWHIKDLDQVRLLKKRPSLERRLRVVHALAQLSGAYLKVVEADAVMAAVPTLQAQVQQLLAESRNGHGHP